MNRIGFIFLLLIISGISVTGQTGRITDSTKYRINLPGYWKPGNKIWQVLSDKLPFVCPELRDKLICGDNCHPLYSIEMIMTKPMVYDYAPAHLNTTSMSESWQIQTLYGFECSLLLMNDRGNVLTRFVIVDTNEVWHITNKASLATYTPTKPVRYVTTGRNPQPVAMQNPVPATLAETPFSYINNNREKLMPTLNDLFTVVDNKIRSW